MYECASQVQVIRTTGSVERVAYVPQRFAFQDLSLVPRQVMKRAQRQPDLMWAVLEWGLPADQFDVLDNMPMSGIMQLVSEWEQASQVTIEDIARVINTIENHSEPVEMDLIDRGLRLRNCPSPEFNWRDLYVILKNSGPHTHYFRAINPEAAGWDLPAQLQAQAVDILRWLQWVKTEAAQEPHAQPPPLIPRPGVKAGESRDGELKGRRMTLERAKKRFDRPDPDREKKLFTLFRS